MKILKVWLCHPSLGVFTFGYGMKRKNFAAVAVEKQKAGK